MKILLKILFVIFALITLLIFLLLSSAFLAWIGDGGNVLFPGLGLIVSMGVIVILLLTLLMSSAVITFLLFKFAF